MRVVLLFLLSFLFCINVSAQTDKEFWFAAPEVTRGHVDSPLFVRVTTLNVPATVTISCPANPAFTPITQTIAANSIYSFPIGPYKEILENKPPNTVLNYGLLVTSNQKVLAYYDESSGNNPEIFALKGHNALGTNFIIPGQNTMNNGAPGRYNPQPYNSFDIVATQDNTKITITPTKDVVGHLAGIPYTITLNKGQTYSAQATSPLATQHLTGSTVTSNKPIAITYKDDSAGQSSCYDLMGDQIVPIPMLGLEYIVVNGDLNNGGTDQASILAVQDGTVVNVLQNGNLVSTQTLNKGQFFQYQFANSPIYIKANKPISVMHITGTGCELGSAVVPQIGCTGSTTVGLTRPAGTDYFKIFVLAHTNAVSGFTFNGSSTVIKASDFTVMPGAPDWSYAKLDITSVLATNGNALIQNSIDKFHVGALFGTGSGCGYGYFSDYASYDPVVSANDPLCVGSTLQLKCNPVNDPGDLSFNWDGPNGFLSSVQNPTIPNITTAGAGTYNCQVFKQGCFYSLQSIDVTVNTYPVSTPTAPASVCLNGSLPLTGNTVTGATYSWVGPAGSNFTSTQQSPIIDPVTSANKGTYTLTVTTNGCSTSNTVFVDVKNDPIPVITGPGAGLFCEGATINLTSSSTTSPVTYSWTGPNGFTSTQQNPTITNATAAMSGTYSVLITSTANGCSDTKTANVTINTQPTVSASNEGAYCGNNNTAKLHAVTNLAPADAIFTWTGPNGFTSSLKDPVINNAKQNPDAGLYTVTVKSASSTCSSASASTYLIITTSNTAPTINSISGSTICDGTTLTLTANMSSNTPSPALYTWTGPNGYTNSGVDLKSISIPNASAAAYNGTQFKLVVTTGCQTATLTTTVTVNTRPILIITNPAAVCSGTSVNLTASAITTWSIPNSNLNYYYYTDANGTTSLSNPSSVTAAGTYYIKIQDKGTLCYSDIQSVTVVTNPTPSITSTLSNQSKCVGESTDAITITGNTPGASYVWTNDNTATGITVLNGSGDIPSFVTTNTTTSNITSTIKVTPSLNGCNGTQKTITITVKPVPTVSVPADTAICNGKTSGILFLKGSIKATTYTWVSDHPEIGLSNGTQTAASNSANLNIPAFTVTNSTSSVITDLITVTPTFNGCTGQTGTFKIVANPTPSVTVPANLLLCSGERAPQLNFVESVSGTIFNWTNTTTAIGLTGAGSGNIQSFTALNNGTANIIATINVTPSYAGCVGSAKPLTITVKPSPSITAPADLTLCNGIASGGIFLAGTIRGTTYSWVNTLNNIGLNDGNVTAASNTSNAIIPSFTAINTTYATVTDSVIVTPSFNGCISTPDTFRIIVNPNPNVYVPANLSLCKGETTPILSFTSDVTGTNFTWANNTTSIGLSASGSGNIAAFTAVNNTTAAITATITVTPQGTCAGTAKTFTITVKPTPKVTTPADITVCSGKPTGNITLTGNISGANYTWVNTRTDIGLANGSQNGTPNYTIPSFTAISTDINPVIDSIFITPSLNGCTGTPDTLRIIVNPAPVLTSTQTAAAICSKTAFSYTATSATTGVTFSWSRAAITGISNTAVVNQSGAVINETLINTTTSPIVVTYKISMVANGCAANIQDVTVTVNPTPSLSNAPASATICNNGTFNYTPASSSTGASFSWTRDVVSGISNPAANGNGAISEVLTNTVSVPVVVKYAYTLAANGCSNNGGDTVKVTVNPTPRLTNVPNPAIICSNTAFTYTPSSSTPGATYTWVRAAVTGISNPAASGSNGINETLINTLSTPVDVKYVYSISINGCVYDPADSFVVTVNPKPVLNNIPAASAICNDQVFSYTPSSTTTGVTYSWTRAAISGITPATANGNGSINETLHSDNSAVTTVTYLYTLSANSCTNSTTEAVTVNVNPTPKLNSTLTATDICNDGTVSYTPTSATTGTSFAWTRASVTGITPATGSGNGNINETLHNASSDPVTVTYVYTLAANSCTAPSTESVTVVVKPTPKLSSVAIATAICNDGTVNYTPTSNTPGATYSWTRAAVSGITPATGSGNGSINETLHNGTADPVTVTYIYTLSANSCTAPSTESITVVVKPSPKLNSPLTVTDICNNGTVHYTPSSTTVGTIYSWTRAAISGITAGTNSGTGDINETLHSDNSTITTVSYLYTLSANGCTNSTTEEVKVNVKPTPKLSSPLTATDICNDGTVSYTPTSATTGTTYSWTRAAITGITPATNSGNGNINETLHNGTTDPITVTYVYTLSANGCAAPSTESVIVVVKSTPKLSSATTATAICNDGTVNYTPTSNTTGTTYNWTRAAVTGITPATGNGNGDINETLHNGALDPITVSYVYTLSANGCTAPATETVTVVVKPTPKLSSSLTATDICNDGTVNYTPTSATTSTTYNWTRAAVTGITPATSNGTGNINEALHNATSDPITVSYIYTLSANGCTAPSTETVTVIVKPTPKLSSSLTATDICNDGTVNYTPTSATAGTTYAWARAAVGHITPSTGGGNGSINETLHNDGSDPVTVTYIYTLSANSCTAPTTETVTVVVKPTPKLNSPLTATDICNDGTVTYTPSSATTGTTYSWTRAAVTGITPSTNSGTGDINETLHNNTASPITVTYVYTLSANGCAAPTTESITVVVKPTPKLSSPLTATDICNDGTVNYTATSATSGTTYSWTRAAVTGITPSANSGTGNISETLHNNTTDPITVSYVYTLSANGCTAPATETVTVVVKPTPKLSSSLTATDICSDGTVNYTPTSVTSGTTYTWTRAAVGHITPSTGSGTGAISETLHNDGSDPVTVTYLYTLSANGCTVPGTEAVTVVVKPTPKLSSLLTATDICNDGTVSYTPASTTTGTTYAWTRAAVGHITPSTGSGNGAISETLHNDGSDPVTVTYVYTLSANGCTAPATETVTVVVKPTAKLSSSLTATDICNDGTVNYTPTSATAGTTYNWTRAAVTGITPATGGGNGNINETLHNNTTDPITVSYVYTLSANGCTAPATETVTVVVKPTPKLNSATTATDICNDGTVSYTPTSQTTGTTYAWARATVGHITPSTGSGNGAISETLHNDGSDPVTVTYVYTLSANGCTAPATETVTVVVKPTPKLNSALTIAEICNDGTVNYTPASATTGTTYSWTRAAVADITPTTASGSGSISETLHNAGTNPHVVTYQYTLSANGCTAPTTEEVKVTVNPTPKLNSSLTIAAICNDNAVNYTPTSVTTGTTYSWTRAAVTDITPATGSGNGNINETLHNDGTAPRIVTYLYTLTANGCTAPATEEVKVTVNPSPKLNSLLTIDAICNDGTVNYTPASATTGTTYTWTRAAVTDITPATATGNGGINEILHNNGTSPQVVTYVYTLTANGCTTPTTEEVKVTVNPTPKLNSALTIATICNDGTVSYTPTSATAGTTYTWTRSTVADITPATASGTGNINETLHNGGTAPQTVTYTYTLSANNCTVPATEEVKVTVNPTPKLNSALTIADICNDGTVNYTPTSATTGTTYAWTRAAVGHITPSTANGNGVINESLHNDGSDPVVVTYVYTLTANGCTAPTTEEVKVTVNPTPKLSSALTIAAICNDGTVTYTPTSTTTGTTYSWTRAAVTDITPSTGNGTGNINETLHNAGSAPQVVTYVYTLSANGCTAPATEEVKVTVNPTPKLNSALTIADICNDGTVNYTPTSTTTGTTYSWTRAAVTDITPSTGNGTGNINETLHNAGTAPQVVTYVYTLSANGCAAPTTEEVKITVNPTPKLNSALTIAAICNDGTVNYTPTSATTGTTYSWTRAAVSDITPSTGSGTGSITETLHNAGTAPQVVTYVYTLSANGCTAPTTEEVKVTVNPTPKLSSALTIAAICNDGTVNYTPTSATTGTTYSWTRAAVTDITPSTGSGTGSITETLHNNGTDPQVVTYTYTLSANGCTTPTTEEVKVTVNPTPKLSSALTIAAICNDGTVNYTPTSATTGTTYTWTRTAVNHITPATGNGTGNIAEVLHNDGTDPVTVTYVYTLSANGCTVPTTEEVKVTVNPTPKLSSALTIAAICNDGTVNYTPTSATTGTTYSWTRAAVTDITPSTGSGTGNISETLHNNGTDPQVVTYIYTLSANGCTAPTTEEVKVTVNPTPKLSSALTIAAICNDGIVNYTPTSATTGTTYSWTRAAVTDITPSTGSGTGNISETLHNDGAAPQVVTYVYTLSANGCTAPTTEEVKVTVNPTSKLSSALTIAAICNDGTVSYTPTSATTGTTYIWTRAAVTGITPSTGNGTGNISEALHNDGTAPVVVTYIYTLTANGCTAPSTEEVKVTVNPTPKLNSALTIAAICNDGTVNYTPTSATSGTSFVWNRPAVANITPSTASGNGNINEVLHNDSADPIVVTYLYILSANGCTAPATEEVKVTVNPTPKLSSALTIAAICNDATVNYTPTSTTTGTTYAWTRAAANHITPATGSGNGNINETLHNDGTDPVEVTYVYTLTANGCTVPTTEEVKVTVNPTPKLNSALTIAAICNDGTVNYTPTSATTGTTYSWTRAAVTDITPSTGNGNGNINETLHNDGTAPQVVTYIYTLSANGCTAPTTEEVKVTVNPTPKLSSALTIAAICNDGTVNYTPTSATTGTTYAWTRAAANHITPATGSGNGNINETLHNDGTDPVEVTYVYTLTANGCTVPTTEEVKVTVNPTPRLNSALTIAAICNDGTVNYTPTSATTGTTYSWTRAAVTDITPSTGSGTGNINETLHNATTDPIIVTYIYTLSANGCTAPATEEVKVTVNPTPKLTSALTIAAICNDGTVNYTPASATAGTTYSWTRAAVTDITPSTGSGTGNISETLHNAGSNPQVVTYIYTLSANGCTAPATEEVKVTVNPTPKLSSALTIATICNDGTVNYTPASATTGTSFAWTRSAVTGITPATASGNGNISETLHNETPDPITVTYVYSLSANGCTAPTTEEVKVVVNPTPKLSSALTIAAICNDGTVAYTPSSATTGTTYSWTRATVTDITPATGNGTGNINETLHNAGTNPQVVTYVYTLTANGCTAPTTEEVRVTVNPTPKLSSALTIAAICNDGTVNYTPTSATTGTSFAWSRPAVTGITPATGSGNGDISEALHNATTDPITVTYVYTLTANGCTAPTTEEVKVVVNPTPKLSSALTIAAICNDGTVAYAPSSATAGTTYTWIRAAVNHITPATGSGVGAINEVLRNDGTDPATVTYVYTLTANGCTAPTTEQVKVVVNPTPKLTSALTITAICNDGTVNYTPSSATAGTTYSWTRAAVTDITPSTGSGTGDINETLHNSGASPQLVTYVYTLSANGCTAPTTEEVKVTVNPTPKLSSALTIAAICNDGTVNYTPTSATIGTTYTWTRPAVTGITPSTGSGNGNINEVLHNATTDPVTVTYVYTLTANGCTAPTTEEVKVVVNPTPKLSSALTIAAICNDGTVNYTPASATAGTTYTWTRAAVNHITPATGNGVGNINETLHNDGTDPVTVTYLYTLTAKGCTAPTTEEVKVVVNPTPKLSSALTIAAICNDGTVNYTPASATAGTTYTWTRPAVIGITPATANGNGAISETLHNATADPVTVTYLYTLTANGCTAPATEEVKVVVNPTPKLSSALTIAAICNDGTVVYAPASATTGTSFAWTRPAVTGITPATANGTGNINETLHNATADPITVTYIYTLTANGCTAPTTEEVKVVVNPTPKLSSPLTITAICNDGTVNYTPSSATAGTTYTWTRAAVNHITPATGNGTGNINETLHNDGIDPVTVTYVYSLTANGCTAPTTEEVKVVVNPTPKLSSALTIAAICNDGTVNYTPSSATTGTSFTWTRPAVTGITPSTGNGSGAISETLHNATTDPVTVTYVYSLAANGCTAATTEEVKVVVNPTPKLSSPSTIAAICNDGTVNYTPSSVTAGASFVWTRAAVPGITPATSNGTGNISEQLHNATTDPITVTYLYTLTANGCTAPATEEVKVVINPTPKLSSALTIAAICNDGTVNYTPTSATAGASFVWTRAAVPGITPATGNGTGNISEQLHNATTSPVTVTYLYTLSANGCTAPATEEVKVVVNPTPKLSSVLTIAAICNDDFVRYTPASATTGASFAWVRPAVAGIIPATSNGAGGINETLHNTTADPLVVTYVYTLTANGCAAPTTEEVKVTVNPTPKLSSALTIAAICNSNTVNYVPASSTTGATFTWVRPAIAGITPATGNGTGAISEQLTNTSADPITVTYLYTLSANGCTAPTTEQVKVVVNPTAKLSSTLNAGAICNNETFAYTPTSTTTGTTYSWTRAAVPGITPATGNGTGAISEQLTNSATAPIVVTYVYTLTANGCTNPTTEEVKVTVNPTAKLNNIVVNDSICNKSLYNYTPASATAGVTYIWTRAAVPGITPASANGTGNISEVLENTTAAPVTVAYNVLLKANGCTNPATETIYVVVKPTPVLYNAPINDSICNKTAFTYTAASNTANITYSWSRASVNGINPATGNGTGATINEVLENTTANPVTVTYKVTMHTYGCADNTQDVTVVVKPTPVLSSAQVIAATCNSAAINYTATSNTINTWFNWSRDAVTGISNPAVANQPGYIIKETLENTTANPVTVTYKVTMHTYGCADNTQDVTVVVKPTPVLTSTTAPDAICNNGTFTYTATSATSGTVFSWTRPQVNGIQNAAAGGTTADINEKLINTTNAPVNVTYYISMKLDNCKESIQPVIVTVRPTADVVVPKDAIVCNNTSTGLFKFNSNVAGTTYTWTNNNTAIGLAANGSGDIASFTATNPGTTPLTAIITVTPATATCPGIPQTFKVIVNPTPVVNPVADITICDTKLYAGVKFSGNVDETTYTWTNDNTAVGLPKSGDGSIGMFTAINNGNNPITANILVTPHANGCDGLATSFRIIVNPTPHLASPLNAGEICSEQQLTYNVASTVINTVFDWKRDAVAGISNIATTGKNNIGEQLTNTTDKPVVATYSYTLTANGCTNVETVKATVKPLPVPTITGTTTVCSAAQLSLQANSNIGADSYAWTGPNGFTANTQSITVQAADVINGNSYTVTVTRNGCVSHAVAQTITVKPLPVIQITGTPQICENGDINLVANAGTGVTYKWTGPNNFSGTGSNMLIRNAGITAAGVYTVTVTGNGCSKDESIAVAVKPLPSARISGTPVVCSGNLIKLEATDAGNNATYKWNGPANFSLNDKIVMINKATEINAGTYKLEVDKDGCSAQTSIRVEVNPFPSIKVLSKLPACDNADILIQANSSLPNSTFRWIGPNNISSTQQELAIAGFKGDTLKAYVYVTKNGCMSKDSIFLPVKKSPLVKMIGPMEVCQNAPLQQYLAFEQTGLPGKGIFSGPGITKEGTFNPSFAPGTFTLKYTYTTTDGCEDSKAVTVKVNPIPNVNAGPDKVMYEGFGTILNGSVRGSYTSFEWNTPDTSHLLTPTVTPKVTTTYRLTARNSFGCMAFDDVQVQVVKFNIPNSFSPNGDGINDKWIINALDKYPDVRVEIFNRWGTRLYLCTGVYIPWDGTYNGQPVPTGTYYYLIDLKDGINRKPFSGWIEILR